MKDKFILDSAKQYKLSPFEPTPLAANDAPSFLIMESASEQHVAPVSALLRPQKFVSLSKTEILQRNFKSCDSVIWEDSESESNDETSLDEKGKVIQLKPGGWALLSHLSFLGGSA